MNPSLAQCVPFLYKALASPKGIVLTTSNVELAKSRLYKARAECGDPKLSVLNIQTSRTNPLGAVWLFKTSDPLPTEPASECEEPDPAGGS